MKLFWIFLGCLILFLTLNFMWKMPAVSDMDEEVLSFFTGIRTDALTSFFLVMTELGSIKILFPLIVLLSLFFLVKREYSLIFFLFLVLWGARGLNEWIKKLIGRPRPDMDPLIYAGGSSFPSGHAMNSAAVYGFLIYLILNKKEKKLLWTFVLVSVIILVSLSRMYLGVHYFTDVAAGLIAGLAWAVFAVILIPLVNKILIKLKGR